MPAMTSPIPPPLAVAGVSLPFLTDLDPDESREGSLDPMGLAPLADRLADLIAPDVTARMSRVRFITAIAVGATVTAGMQDLIAADGVTPAYIAFEWHLVEALARQRDLQASATLGVPGIGKARSMLALGPGRHLDSHSYLKGPRVFGFTGVYKRLARALGIVTPEIVLLERGDTIARIWEQESGLEGFTEQRSGTAGGNLARSLVREVQRALFEGSVRLKPRSPVWGKLAAGLRPDRAGVRERTKMRAWLQDSEQPVRTELTERIATERRHSTGDRSDADLLRAVAPHASPELAIRIGAIEAYERAAQLLYAGFQGLLYVSTGYGTAPVAVDRAGEHPLFERIALALPSALRQASEQLEPLGLSQILEETFATFDAIDSPTSLVDALLEHHVWVQRAKGRLPWLAIDGLGFRVRRFDYRRTDEPAISDGYIHPYRARSLNSFLADLGSSGDRHS
jgi:hypothetical protein